MPRATFNIILEKVISAVKVRFVRSDTGAAMGESAASPVYTTATATVASLPLPAGASTAAHQVTQNGLLTTIDADTSKIPTDPAKESGKLTTIDSTLTALNALVTTLNGLVTLIKDTDGIKKIMDAVAVTGTFWQATQPVSGTFYQATQPVSGTVQANAGTNLNTSALALEAGGNLEKTIPPTTCTQYFLNLTVSNTEYSQALPAGTKRFHVQCRQASAIRWAFTTGKVAGSVEPYGTMKSNSELILDHINLTGKTLYFAGGTANREIEITAWT